MADCNITASLQKLRLYVAVDASLSIVSSLACLVTIVLFVALGAYRSYVHRLNLNLAITSLFLSVLQGLSVAPINTNDYPLISQRNGWNNACAAFGSLIQYFGYSSALATLWICINVFALSVFNVKTGRRSCEAIGYLVIFFIPCLVFWIPFLSDSFGQTSVWCWIRCSSDQGNTLAASLGPILALYFTSLVMIIVVVVSFVIELMRGHFKVAHKAALKEVLPLLIYPGTFSLVFGLAAFTPLYVPNTYRSVSWSIFTSLILSTRLLLPLSILLQPSIRRRLYNLPMKTTAGVVRDARKDKKEEQYEASVMGTTTIKNIPDSFTAPYQQLKDTT